MSKLWQKGKSEPSERAQAVNRFTVGQDRFWDLKLAPFDILGSIAHVMMLGEVGLLPADEVQLLVAELRIIFREIQEGTFELGVEVEDVHSHVEFLLTERLGEMGKKIHMARSRNDQVLVDIKMYLRRELEWTVDSVSGVFEILQQKAKQHEADLMPGYTHLQLAMPSSFGLWFGAYAESLVDDLISLQAAFEIIDQNPLGSAAGFGSSFPISRRRTTELLGFGGLAQNVVYAQMGRGKSERIASMALANLADTLARLSMDVTLFLNQNFGFIDFPSDLTTGSSIMPHKKNPDVFELIRARCNRIKALPNEILMVTSNLPSGYHRDLQILKEHVFPAFSDMRDCLALAEMMLAQIQVRPRLLDDPKYKYLFSVEEVNRRVLQGLSFREAYRQVGESIESGTFAVGSTQLEHTHEGSLGNLGLEAVRDRFVRVRSRFPFDSIRAAFSALLGQSASG